MTVASTITMTTVQNKQNGCSSIVVSTHLCANHQCGGSRVYNTARKHAITNFTPVQFYSTKISVTLALYSVGYSIANNRENTFNHFMIGKKQHIKKRNLWKFFLFSGCFHMHITTDIIKWIMLYVMWLLFSFFFLLLNHVAITKENTRK